MLRQSLALLCLAAATLSAQEEKQTPKNYDIHRTKTPLVIDGKIDEKAWKKAAWTDYFQDIEGDAKPAPRFKTRAKMLWDDQYLYIAAEMEEPDVKATLTKHDSVIFKDNDFEVFMKPLADDPGYFEFEMNALNTGWDLYLNKPYREHGHADNSWDMPGLKTAVAVQGTLNDSTDVDKGWTVELAIPWADFKSRQPVEPPKKGDTWRVNFSRVEYKEGIKKEANWTWSAQGIINMHAPAHWSYVHFKK